MVWSKYVIIDKIDSNAVILWSTLNSNGITVYGEVDSLLQSATKRIWDENIDINLKKALTDIGIILKEDQEPLECKLVEKLRAEAVYDDTFMSLTIIPTDRCNFRCLYCYQSDTYHNMSDDVADSIIKMIKQCRALKVLHVSWFGGEPLCNKELVFSLMEKINQVCKEKKIVLMADMTTNASLLDLETFSKLYSLKVLNYQITIDGCKETHDVQRPMFSDRSSFDIILNNLRIIRDNAVGKFFKIGIRTNFTSFVDEHFGKMKDILVNEFSHDKRFYFFFQWVKNWGGNRVSEISDQLLSDDQAITQYGRWMDVMSQTGVRTGDVTMIRACSGLCIGCRKNSYLINTDGTLCKCTTGIYDTEYKDKAIIGHIDKDGNRVVDKWKEIEWITCDANTDDCNRCNLYPICLGMPCPYYKIKHKRIICNKEDNYIRFMLRAMARQGYLDSIYIRGE